MTDLSLKIIFLMLIMVISTSSWADLQDDPAEDVALPPKEGTKAAPSGLIRDESETKPLNSPKVKEEKEKRGPKSAPERPSEKSPDKTPASSANNANSNAPIKYRSEQLAGQKSGGVVVLEENVVVTQADMRIEADKATLHFDQATNEVIDCVAVGNVHFFRKDPETGNPVTAEGREAIFNNKERTVILKGDPKLTRGGDVVRGRQILYDLTSGWVKADRVEGVVQPTKQDSGKSTKGAAKTDAKKEPSTPPSESPDAKESPKP